MFSVGDKVKHKVEGYGTVVAIHTKGTADVLFDGRDHPIRPQESQLELVEPAYLPNPYRSNGEVVPFKKKKGLSKRQRASLPDDDFCILHTDKRGRTRRSFPINDYYHGRLALVYSMWPNNAHNRQRVKKCVFARYPKLIDWWNNTEWVQNHPGEEYYGEELRRVANPGHEIIGRKPKPYFKDKNGDTWKVIDWSGDAYSSAGQVEVERDGRRTHFIDRVDGKLTSWRGNYPEDPIMKLTDRQLEIHSILNNNYDLDMLTKQMLEDIDKDIVLRNLYDGRILFRRLTEQEKRNAEALINEYYADVPRQRRRNPHHMHIHWKHVNGGGPYRNLGAMRLNPRKKRKVPIGAFPDDYEWFEQQMLNYLKFEYNNYLEDSDTELVKGMTSHAKKALFQTQKELRDAIRRFYIIYKKMYFENNWIQVWRCIEVEHGEPIMFGKDLGIHWAYTRRAAYDFCVENFGFTFDADLVMLTGFVSRIDVNWVSSIRHGLIYSFDSFVKGEDTGEDELIVVNPQSIRNLQYDKLPVPDNYR